MALLGASMSMSTWSLKTSLNSMHLNFFISFFFLISLTHFFLIFSTYRLFFFFFSFFFFPLIYTSAIVYSSVNLVSCSLTLAITVGRGLGEREREREVKLVVGFTYQKSIG